MNDEMLRLILPVLCSGKEKPEEKTSPSVPSQDDKTFIILLILLLMKEKSDIYLLLALLYILM